MAAPLVHAQTEISISMAGPAPEPRLHSPGRIGIYPGTPFAHTIGATGQAPLTVAVAGLPPGLTLDAATGRVSGTVASAGEYPLDVSVTNAAGRVERRITLSVGDTLALTPPMGWNSYDSFDDDVREAEFLAQARFVRDNLLAYGWDTVVVDFRWYDPNTPASDQGGSNPGLTIDANGRLLPAINKFPSAAAGVGFRAIADQVHALGLKFGIHIMRGIPRIAVNGDLPILNSSFSAEDAARAPSDNGYTCVWNSDMYGVRGDTAAGQAWYDSIFALYASWGVDFVKVDDMTKNRPANQIEYHRTEVEAIVGAIEKSGRSMVFSLSPGETPLGSADHVQAWGNMWRMSDDFWDRPGDLDHMFALADAWQVVGDVPGHWPDADMLPLGHLGPRCPVEGSNRETRFTRNEQVTMLTLWALLPSPLMLGANLVQTTDAWTRALLTNDEVLAVSQDALGARARRVALTNGREVWVKALSGGRHAVGLFNRGAADQEVAVGWAELGIAGRFAARKAWQREDLGFVEASLAEAVPSRAAVLVVLSPEVPPDPGGAGGAAGASGATSAGSGGVSSGGAAGTAPTSGGGGLGESAAGGASAAGSGAAPTPNGGSTGSAASSGCGCTLPPAASTAAPAWLLALAWASRRFRRRAPDRAAR